MMSKGVADLRVRMFQDCHIPHATFFELLNEFLQDETDAWCSTTEIERFAGNLISEGFDDEASVQEFVKKVCKWGGSQGNRVLRKIESRDFDEVATAFGDAVQILESAIGNVDRERRVVAALKRVKQIYGLDVAFASKHLRFLCPRLCPVLDSVISDRTIFSVWRLTDYGKFSTYCVDVAQALTEVGIKHPISSRQGMWYAADVEAAIYWYLRNNE